MTTRLKRDDPERFGPIRGWETLFRHDETADASSTEQAKQSNGADGVAHADGGNSTAGTNSTNGANGAAGPKSSWDEIANGAIERGYQVIEEQIRQGQRVAEQFRGYSDDLQKTNSDVSRMVERSVRLYTDIGYLWFELVQSLLRNPTLTGADLRRQPKAPDAASPGESPDNANGEARSTHRDTEIEVSCPYPTSVALDLKGPAGPFLVVAPLRALDPSKPPLTEVRFEDGGSRPKLRVTIPAGQPPDKYTGVVIDTRTSEPWGTVCVCVRSSEDSSA